MNDDEQPITLVELHTAIRAILREHHLSDADDMVDKIMRNVERLHDQDPDTRIDINALVRALKRAMN